MYISTLLVEVVMVVTVHAVSEYFIHQPDKLMTAMAGDKVGSDCTVVMGCPGL
jgi:hypothetical protein